MPRHFGTADIAEMRSRNPQPLILEMTTFSRSATYSGDLGFDIDRVRVCSTVSN